VVKTRKTLRQTNPWPEAAVLSRNHGDSVAHRSRCCKTISSLRSLWIGHGRATGAAHRHAPNNWSRCGTGSTVDKSHTPFAGEHLAAIRMNTSNARLHPTSS